MKNKNPLLIALPLLLTVINVFGQQKKTTAELLGYPADAKLLILHADDAGVSHSVNAATIEALEKGAISSASIMVPCPWFPEIAAYAKAHPEYDFGLHLTLTAEWKYLKWDGVLPANEIPSLIGPDGYFYASTEEVAKNANPAEVEKEIKAQVERAIAFGIQPTHLDSHMGSLFATPALFEVYVKVGKEYGIPVFVPGNMAGAALAQLPESLRNSVIPVDNLAMMGSFPQKGQWLSYYSEVIKNLKPGLNEIIIHLAYDNDEMQAVCIDHPDFGSEWRQQDLDVMLHPDFRKLLEEEGVKLVPWRDVQKLMRKKMGKE